MLSIIEVHGTQCSGRLQTHLAWARPFWMSKPLATEPIPATTAAGGQNEEMAAATPTMTEIGAINFVGG